MWDQLMFWGGNWGRGGGLLDGMHILWWVLVIGVVLGLKRWLARRGPRDAPPAQDRRAAAAALRERYARGEIDQAEFEKRQRDLHG